MKVFLKASSKVESSIEHARKISEEPRQSAKAAINILDLVGDFHEENCYDRKNFINNKPEDANMVGE